MTMEAEWKKAIMRFILNNLGQMDQEDVIAWLDGDLEIAPLLEPVLRKMAPYRSMVLRELHQISPPEVFDRLSKEHPELVFSDKQKAVIRIGRELEALKAIVASM
ncbi:MAG TPA: hypothetical protein VJ489_01195 [Thermoplasmata archaeon]|nr:hypothetical protein [Thermoplasmata archaeon]